MNTTYIRAYQNIILLVQPTGGDERSAVSH